MPRKILAQMGAASAVAAVVAWALIAGGMEGVSRATRVGYGAYVPFLAAGMFAYFAASLWLHNRLTGAAYIAMAIAWALFGWVLCYGLCLALALATMAGASVLAVIYIPVGGTVNHMAFAAALVASATYIVLLVGFSLVTAWRRRAVAHYSNVA